MAGERALPGLGLYGFWTLGSNGYKDQLDGNLRLLSALVQAKVLSRVASVPGSPTDGDMHIITAGGDANKIAIRDNGAWVYVVPSAGFISWSVGDSKYYVFNGTVWTAFDPLTAPTFLSAADTPASFTAQALKVVRVNAGETALEFATVALPDPFSVAIKTASYSSVSADFSGNKLIRMNLATGNSFTVDPSMSNGEPVAVSQMGVGQTTIVAGSGVTLVSSNGLKLRAQYSVCTIMKLAADSYLVSGDLTT